MPYLDKKLVASVWLKLEPQRGEAPWLSLNRRVSAQSGEITSGTSWV
jgi:hypothetical protein